MRWLPVTFRRSPPLLGARLHHLCRRPSHERECHNERRRRRRKEKEEKEGKKEEEEEAEKEEEEEKKRSKFKHCDRGMGTSQLLLNPGRVEAASRSAFSPAARTKSLQIQYHHGLALRYGLSFAPSSPTY